MSFLIQDPNLIFDLVVYVRLGCNQTDAVVVQSGWYLLAIKAADYSIEVSKFNRLTFLILAHQ